MAVAEPTTDTEPLTLRAFVAEEYREQFLEIYEVEPEWRFHAELLDVSRAGAR